MRFEHPFLPGGFPHHTGLRVRTANGPNPDGIATPVWTRAQTPPHLGLSLVLDRR